MTRPRRKSQRAPGVKLTPNDKAELEKFRAYLEDSARMPVQELQKKYTEYLGLEPYQVCHICQGNPAFFEFCSAGHAPPIRK